MESIRISKEQKELRDRNELHIELHCAIKEIESLKDQALRLFEKITGSTPENPSAQNLGSDKEPTLRDILLHGPDHIRHTTEEVRSLIVEIEAVLF